MKKLIISLGILCIFPATIWAQSSTVIIPQKPSNFVTDLANVLDDREETLLNEQLSQVEKNTTAEIAVLTVPSIDELRFNGTLHDIDGLGYAVFKTWKIGKADTDNGVLILVAINDRKFRIEVGDGAEGSLTDNHARIIAELSLAPHFRKQAYFNGLSETAKGIEKLIKSDPSLVSQVTEEAERQENSEFEGFAGFGIFLAFFFSLFINGAITHISSSKHKAKKRIVTTGIIGFLIGLGLLIANIVILIATMLMMTSIAMILFSSNNGGSGSSGGGTYWGGSSWGSGGSSFGGGFGGFGGGSSSGGGFSGGW